MAENDEARGPVNPPNEVGSVAVTAPSKAEIAADAALIKDFCKASGYKPSDVAAVRASTRTVVTKNGGKYQVSKNGKNVRHILGPQVPGAAEDEE